MKTRVQLAKGYIGYTLAEDVYKEKQMKLINEGSIITERLYESLKKHNIRNIYVYSRNTNQ